jgi:chromosome segregation ATPase
MLRALRDEHEAGQAHADATIAAERDGLRDQVDALLAQRDAASAECDDLKAQLDAALDAARAMRVSHERTESGRAALEVEASDLRSRMRELQDLCDERQAEASRAGARLGALEAELAGAGTVRDAYRLAMADQAARWRALIDRVDE